MIFARFRFFPLPCIYIIAYTQRFVKTFFYTLCIFLVYRPRCLTPLSTLHIYYTLNFKKCQVKDFFWKRRFFVQSAVSIVRVAQKSELIFVQPVKVNSNTAQTLRQTFVYFAKSIGKLHKNFGILDIKVCAKCRVQKIPHVNVNHNRGPNMSADGPSNCTKIFHIVNKNCAICTFVKLHNKKAVENCCVKCTNGILHKKRVGIFIPTRPYSVQLCRLLHLQIHPKTN